MQVRIDGKLVERTSYFVRDDDRGPFGSATREEPDLLNGEQAVWALGDPIPTIIRVGNHE
ncbi:MULTISPECIES: hypothetical protein [Pseudomonas]|uniref:hypothetical protein n=1 Tax=Pseudomonas TaxID=286 RepID=UPI00044F05B9|nr:MULTISPECIES: hypothetical protein [Pseudomonas]ETU81139.1 hypothetical protein Q094_05844 [Pseudomonas aeruginosa PS42]WOB61331.1 hypothetical protein NY023_13040 [Pseudomonas sp. NBB]